MAYAASGRPFANTAGIDITHAPCIFRQSYPNTNVSSVASPYRKSSKLVNDD